MVEKREATISILTFFTFDLISAAKLFLIVPNKNNNRVIFIAFVLFRIDA